VISSVQQCSRVDWYTDEAPRLTIVTDGVESVELLSISPNARITVQSCKVCRDAMFPNNQASILGETPAPQTAIDLTGAWDVSHAGCGQSWNWGPLNLTQSGSKLTGWERPPLIGWIIGNHTFTGEVVGTKFHLRQTDTGSPFEGEISSDGSTITGTRVTHNCTVSLDMRRQ
jgi:hypothetical protein